MNKTGGKKALKIIGDVLLYLFLLICVLSLIFTLTAKRDPDGTATVFGRQMRIVVSNSMARCDETDVSDFKIKSIPLYSMVFVECVPSDAGEALEWYSNLRVGDVLTIKYVYTTQVTITHRITSITEKAGGYVIELAGDNKNADTDQLYQTIDTTLVDSPNYVIGKVTGQARVFGFLMSLLKQPLGVALLVIVPCFIIILLEVLKIVRVLTAEKKKREQEQMKKKDDELELLRQRLEQLERRAAEPTEHNGEDDSK
ncbi:MAG: hypothetical protein IKA64_03140 [Clostridia bacterium]|nr:hypothetical protein [Clostridia bacterium]